MIPEIDGRPVFPVPKYSEKFFDGVIEEIGGRRLTENEKTNLGQNADYLVPGATIELKILEEEGLEKEERQDRIAKLYEKMGYNADIINIDPKSIPDEIKREFIKVISGPIKTAVTKAAQQIKNTKMGLQRTLDLGCLILVNNGYKFLDTETLLDIALKHARNDTSQIDFVFCTNVEYHQGEYDSYVFCESKYNSTIGISQNDTLEKLKGAINEKFADLMTQMMRNLQDPNLWGSNAIPVKDIIFNRNGVEFRKLAPVVPDSRFQKNT